MHEPSFSSMKENPPLDSRLVRTQPMTVNVEPISSETRTLATRVLFNSARFLLKVGHEGDEIFHGIDARGVV